MDKLISPNRFLSPLREIEATGRTPYLAGEPALQSLTDVWGSLCAGRRAAAILASVAVFVAVLLLARGASQREMALLFGGLESAAAGDVITSLEQRGVIYEVRGGAIYVDAAQRDTMRMALAADGLPANGTQGYELLDSLSGFSTTSQMFDAALWRAREGELARTIQAAPGIRTARVHIAAGESRPFQSGQTPTAAVTISTPDGARPGTAQVEALQYLVASAVPGLSPTDVAVIDEAGTLLSGAENGPSVQSADRAAALKSRAERVLAARVGADNAVVEVTVDTVMESETRFERTLDPDSRVTISTDVTENTEKSTGPAGGQVTVASNVPDGDAASDGGTNSSEGTETRALTNYDVSETERQIVRPGGDVRRLTVAVLVNDITTVAADGTVTTTPRPDEEIEALQALVASAVGFDEARGDVITLQSMSFEPVVLAEGTSASGEAGTPLDMMRLIQLAVLAAVALILGLFVVRPILAGRRDLNTIDGDLPALPDQRSSDDGASTTEQLSGPALAPPDAVARLREMIAERETETVQLLQSWIEDPERRENT